MAVAAVLTFAAPLVASAEGQLQGWVKDAVTSFPVEAARITLDQEPPDGSPEYASETPVVGFFTIAGITPGTYRLRIERPGYETNESSVVIGSGALHQTFSLNPLPGGPGFDLLIQVNDVTTGLQISGVPVTVQRFINPEDVNAAATLTGLTDTNGFLAFHGMTNGFYHFSANAEANGQDQAAWEAFEPAGTTNLTRSYMANLLLKSVPQDLTVQVTGLNPIEQAVGALTNLVVELTGLDPRDTNRVVVPVRNGPTDANGRITFLGLPSAAYRLRTKHLGYDPAEQLIFPDSNGVLSATNVVLSPVFQSNDLQITYTSAYNPAQFLLFYNVPAKVQGLKGTGTEGVNRVLNTTSFLAPPQVRFANNLPPGRYLISVNGTATTNNFYPLRPHFMGEDYVEVMPRRETDVTLSLKVAPTVVHGQLLAADELSDVEITTDPVKGTSARQPIYRPYQQSGIELIEYAPDRLLATNRNVITADTDEAGEFTVSLLPTRYGIRIANMTNYWGSHVVVEDLTTGTSFAQGWPFATNWPYTGQPPNNGTTNAGLPLVFLPNHEYRLSIFVRRQQAYLRDTLTSDFSLPTRLRVLNVLGTDPRNANADLYLFQFFNELHFGGATATLIRGDGFQETLPITNIRDDLQYSPAQVNFAGLTPGTNELTVSVPRQTFQFYDRNQGTYSATSFVAVVPPWNPPGVLPPTNPNDVRYVAPLTVVEDGTPPYSLHGPTDKTITWEVRYWQEFAASSNYSAPEIITNPDRLSFVAPDYADGKIFAYRYLLPDLPGYASFHPLLPTGGFTYWLQFGSSRWFVRHVPGPGDYMEEVYVGGPNNNCTGTAPTPTYDLTLQSVSADDPTFAVSGTTITYTINGSPVHYLMNQTLLGLTNGLGQGTVENPHWQFVSFRSDFPDVVTPVFRTTALMRRGMAFRGSVTNSAENSPLAHAQIVVHDRFGGPLLTLTNADDGLFTSPTALPTSQTLFVEITRAGFKTWRRRFTPADAMAETNDPLNSVLIVNANLEPVPPPEIQDATLDRYGKFLPGVSKSGDESAFDGFSAAPALTMTWTLRAQPQTITNSLPAYDSPDGSPGGVVSREIEDPITEIWFIDPRAFPDNRYSDSPTLVLPPLSDDPYELRAWLDSITSGTVSNVFYQRVSDFSIGPTNQITATNQVPLWKMPPGELKPIWAVVTQSGAVALKQNYQFPTPVGLHQLEGIALPPWLASASDIIGVTAGIKATADQLEEAVPLGHFVPLPEFNASITSTPEGFLNYDYSLAVNWEEGSDTPDSGLLALAPAVLGLDFDGELHFGLSGEAGQVYLNASTDVHKDLDFKRYVPEWARENLEKSDGHLLATNFVSVAHSFPGAQPYEFELTNLVAGGFSLDASANLRPITSKLPYIGPVLLSLDKVGAFQAFADFGGGVGMTASSVWRTPFPAAFPLTDPDPHVLRRHFLGGSEPIQSTDLTLCFNFYGGLRLSALGDALGATGGLSLQGPPCAGLNAPSVTLEINPSGDWPLIKRISGDLNAYVDAHLKVWVVDLGAHYEWPLISFDHQFGTEPMFQLIPLERVNQIRRPDFVPPIQLLTNQVLKSGTTIIPDFFSAGSLAGASGDAGCGFLFTDIDPGTSNMLLKVSLFTQQQTLTPPVTIASAGGIVDATLVPLPTGQWLAAWSEITANHRLDPFAPSVVKSSLSDVGGQHWSAPTTVAAMSDMANQLQLFAGNSITGLVFSHTADGPTAESYSLDAANWDGSKWSEDVQLVTNEPIASIAAAANTGTNMPEALIAYTETNGGARSFSWQNGAWTGPEVASMKAGRHLAVAPGPDGSFRLALELDGGDLALLRFDPVAGWTNLTTIISNAYPAELHLAPWSGVPGSSFLLSWVAGGDVTHIDCAALDETGSLLHRRDDLAGNLAGNYRDLSLLANCGPLPRVIAHYASATDSVQVFDVDFEEPFELANPILTLGGTFEFDLLAATQQTYRVQTSTNLLEWDDLTNLLVTNSSTHVRLSIEANSPRRFYRAVTP